ncbi:MAG: DUF2490 domain-containing protein [Methylococcaceae bacterium]|jgi:hypothetical protein
MFKLKNKIKALAFFFVLPLTNAHAGGPDTSNIFGVWGGLQLQGDFKFLSPELNKFQWLVLNQSRTRDDSFRGSRLTENLLFSQLGYQINDNAAVWLGYVHDWINPLDKSPFQESRPYQDFVWNQSFGDFKFTSRSRFEERINQTTGDTGYRPRELIQVSHPIPYVKGLSAYVGDEVLFYVNKNKFGKQGFSENRILAGFSYQATPHVGLDLGYLGQYVDNLSGNNLFTHNLQANVRYKF